MQVYCINKMFIIFVIYTICSDFLAKNTGAYIFLATGMCLFFHYTDFCDASPMCLHFMWFI